jgi:hypothetical protein
VVVAAGAASVGLLSAEVLEIPARVAARVSERGRTLGLSAVIVTATHTHTSFGRYDPNPLAEVAATGRHDSALEDHLTQRLEDALAQAHAGLRPASLRFGSKDLPGVSHNRAWPGGDVNTELTVAAFESEGALVGQLVIFGAHPTLAPRHGTLDGDYPNRAMQALEQDGGVTLFLQGAVGDVTARPPQTDRPPVETMGERVAQAARDALGAARAAGPLLGLSSVEVALPRAEADHAVPGFLRRPAANALTLFSARTAEVFVLRLGDLILLLLPAEPTVAAASALRDRLSPRFAPGGVVAVVGLAQGYIGYLDTAERVASGTGEAKRTYFGSQLAARIGDGAAVAAEALVDSAFPP